MMARGVLGECLQRLRTQVQALEDAHRRYESLRGLRDGDGQRVQVQYLFDDGTAIPAGDAILKAGDEAVSHAMNAAAEQIGQAWAEAMAVAKTATDHFSEARERRQQEQARLAVEARGGGIG
jgi:hypothetical protein